MGALLQPILPGRRLYFPINCRKQPFRPNTFEDLPAWGVVGVMAIFQQLWSCYGLLVPKSLAHNPRGCAAIVQRPLNPVGPDWLVMAGQIIAAPRTQLCLAAG
jgi:hypothetical protein